MEIALHLDGQVLSYLLRVTVIAVLIFCIYRRNKRLLEWDIPLWLWEVSCRV